MAQEEKKYKIVIVGDGNTGKTTFINRHVKGDFDNRYIPTKGVNVTHRVFHTNKGKITLDLWDCGGDRRFIGLNDAYYINADAALIFFNVCDTNSYQNLEYWYKNVRRVVDNIPIVICANKVDRDDRVVAASNIRFHIRKSIPCLEISSKSNFQFEKPFLRLIRDLLKDNDIMFTSE